MVEEIVYTSSPQGLRPGSRGFCTVASSSGMASSLAVLLESLSGYRHLAQPGDRNPIAYSHLRSVVGGQEFHVLSRVADAGLDYSGRTNKIAHHVAVSGQGLPLCGPAAVQQSTGFHEVVWSGKPRLFQTPRALPAPDSNLAVCEYWGRVTGDPGWGGIVGRRVLEAAGGELWIVYDPSMEPLRLLAEALAIIPESIRWDVTYSTYYTKLPPNIECRVRFVIEGAPESVIARQRYDLQALDLCRPLGAPPEDGWTQAAREGTVPSFRDVRSHSPQPNTAAKDPAPNGVLDAEYEVDLSPFAFRVPPPLPTPFEVVPERRPQASVLKIFTIVATLTSALIVLAMGLYWGSESFGQKGSASVSEAGAKEAPRSQSGEMSAEKQTRGKSNETRTKPADTKSPETQAIAEEKPDPPPTAVPAQEASAAETTAQNQPEAVRAPSPLTTPVASPKPFFSSRRVLIDVGLSEKKTTGEGKAELTVQDWSEVEATFLYPYCKTPDAEDKAISLPSLKSTSVSFPLEVIIGDDQRLVTFSYDKPDCLKASLAPVAKINLSWQLTLKHCCLLLRRKKQTDEGRSDESCEVRLAPIKKLKPLRFSLKDKDSLKGHNPPGIDLESSRPKTEITPHTTFGWDSLSSPVTAGSTGNEPGSQHKPESTIVASWSKKLRGNQYASLRLSMELREEDPNKTNRDDGPPRRTLVIKFETLGPRDVILPIGKVNKFLTDLKRLKSDITETKFHEALDIVVKAQEKNPSVSPSAKDLGIDQEQTKTFRTLLEDAQDLWGVSDHKCFEEIEQTYADCECDFWLTLPVSSNVPGEPIQQELVIASSRKSDFECEAQK